MHPQRLLDDPIDGVHRIEGSVRVLEDRLHNAPQIEQLLAPQSRQIDAVVEDPALGGVDEVEDHVGHGGLARSGLADQRRRRGAAHPEGDVVDGANAGVGAPGPAHVENLGQMLHPQDLGGVLRDLADTQLIGGDPDALGARGLDAVGRQRGGGLDESPGVGVARILEHLQARPRLDDASAMHDDDLLGTLRGQAEVVGHQEHRRAQLMGQPPEVIQDAALDSHIQGAGRLVGNEQAGTRSQTDGDEGALTHAAGELVRVLLSAAGGVGQADVLQQEGHLLGDGDPAGGDGGDPAGLPPAVTIRPIARDLVPLTPIPGVLIGCGDDSETIIGDAGQPVGAQRLTHLEADGPHRVEIGHGILRDHPDLTAAQPPHAALGNTGDVLVPEQDAAPGHAPGSRQQTDDGVGQGGLTRTRFPDDGQALARVDRQIRPADGRNQPGGGAKGHIEVLDAQ